MNAERIVLQCVAALFGVASVAPAWAACEAKSGDTRAALVELYTSEGCSSCPPADRALTRVGDTTPARDVRLVSIALHVDYWDAIGWKDRFAQPAFAERQAWEVRANQRRTSFTPHFFVNGTEVEDWRGDLARTIAKTGAPGARIDVRAEPVGTQALKVHVDGIVDRTARPDTRSLQLFVAVTENGLSSQVAAGENRGMRLEHDHVVRNWIGPIAVQGDRASLDRTIDLSTFGRGAIGVTAFLQDARTAEVVQAVATGSCRPG